MISKNKHRLTISVSDNLFKLIILGSKQSKLSKSQFIEKLLTISITNILEEKGE